MALPKFPVSTPLSTSVGGHSVPSWVAEKLKQDSVIYVEEDFLTYDVKWFVDGVLVLPPEAKRS